MDYLVFHARCDQGMAYYDTKIGTRHPSLRYDLFGKLAEARERKGIALGTYFNAGISSEEHGAFALLLVRDEREHVNDRRADNAERYKNMFAK